MAIAKDGTKTEVIASVIKQEVDDDAEVRALLSSDGYADHVS